MVKIQAFRGYTYSSQDYDTLLKFNHQSLSKLRESTRAYISRTSTEDQIFNGVLIEDEKPCFYIYRQNYMDKSSLGLMAQAYIQDYLTGNIKVHQRTLCRQGLGAESYKQDHVGPIILSFRKQGTLDLKNIMLQIINTHQIFANWNTADGRNHKIWKVSQDLGLGQYFEEIKNLYVLDGHHRLKAAIQSYQICKQNPNDLKCKWFQTLIYPPQQVSIHPFHRIINQVPEKFNILKFFEENSIEYTILKQATKHDLQIYEIIFKNEVGYFGINFKNQNANCIQKLSVHKLKYNILDPVYENQIDNHLNFVPGIHQWEDLVSQNKSIFLVRSIKIQEIFTIADENQIMPPKSTWFEPKPCNKMIIRLPY